MSRKINVVIVGDDKLSKTFDKAGRSARGFGRSVSIGLGSIAKIAGAVLIVNKLSDAVHAGIAEFSENTKIQAQTAAAIKSTGAVAGVSAKKIDELGLSLSNLSGIDDEVVRAGENVLLSFTNIRDRVGKGNDIFTQATKSVVDWSARTGKAVSTTALLLGKALQDPAKKAASLARAGIVLSASQLKQIAAWEKSGKVLKAQKFLLAEVEKRFGGAAKAAGDTLPGQLNILRERFKDLAGEGVGLIAPTVGKAAKSLTGFVRKLSETEGAGAKLSLTANALGDLGRRMFAGIESAVAGIDWGAVWKTVSEKLRAGFDKAKARLVAVDWRGVAHEIGSKLGSALSGLADVINKVNWSQVGAAMVRGFALAVGAIAVFLAHVDWIAVLRGTGRLIVAALRAQALLLFGVAKETGVLIVRGIVKGLGALGNAIRAKLDAAFNELKKLSIQVVLDIIEPFSHLPFGMGKWAQDMKDRLHTQLQAMQKDAIRTATVIRSALTKPGIAPESSGAARAASPRGFTSGGAAPARVGGTTAGAGTGGGGAAMGAGTSKGFKLPFHLQLEQAQAEASKVEAKIVRAAKDIRAFLLKTIPHLKGQKLLDAYGLLAQANDTIATSVKDAADKAKAAAQKSREKMKAAQAKFASALDDARSQIGDLFGGPVLNPSDADRKRALGVAGPDPQKLTADLNAQIAQAIRLNNDLAKLEKRGASTQLLKELRARGTAGLPETEALANASNATLKAFEKAFARREKLAVKVAEMKVHSPRVTLNAAKVVFRAKEIGSYQPVVINNVIELDGRVMAKNTTKHQKKRRRNGAASTRGGNAGVTP